MPSNKKRPATGPHPESARGAPVRTSAPQLATGSNGATRPRTFTYHRGHLLLGGSSRIDLPSSSPHPVPHSNRPTALSLSEPTPGPSSSSAYTGPNFTPRAPPRFDVEENKKKATNLLADLVRLVKLQQQSFESSVGVTIDPTDFSSEEVDEITKRWSEGFDKIRDKENKEKEGVGKAVVEGIVRLLEQMVEQANVGSVDRKLLDSLSVQVEEIKKTSRPALTNAGPSWGNIPASALAVPAQQGSLLHEALTKIRKLEVEVQQSENSREKLRQEVEELRKSHEELRQSHKKVKQWIDHREEERRKAEYAMEQRFLALENKTVDPRRRMITNDSNDVQMTTLAPASAPAQPPPATKSNSTTSSNGSDYDELRKELRDVKERLKMTQESLGKRKKEQRRVEEEQRKAEESGKERFEGLEKQLERFLNELNGTKQAFEQDQAKLRQDLDSLEIPPPSSLSHPSNLLSSLQSLVLEISKLPSPTSMTELEASLLQGLFGFLQSVSESPIDSLPPQRVGGQLQDCLIQLTNLIKSVHERMRTTTTPAYEQGPSGFADADEDED
ncbi:hypothetical protein JCM16303_004936 [Sporobolomyces ruberrimus]